MRAYMYVHSTPNVIMCQHYVWAGSDEQCKNHKPTGIGSRQVRDDGYSNYSPPPKSSYMLALQPQPHITLEDPISTTYVMLDVACNRSQVMWHLVNLTFQLMLLRPTKKTSLDRETKCKYLSKTVGLYIETYPIIPLCMPLMHLSITFVSTRITCVRCWLIILYADTQQTRFWHEGDTRDTLGKFRTTVSVWVQESKMCGQSRTIKGWLGVQKSCPGRWTVESKTNKTNIGKVPFKLTFWQIKQVKVSTSVYCKI